MRVCCAKVQRQQASHPSEAGCMVELTVFSGQVCARRHLAGVFLLWLRTQELSALIELSYGVAAVPAQPEHH